MTLPVLVRSLRGLLSALRVPLTIVVGLLMLTGFVVAWCLIFTFRILLFWMPELQRITILGKIFRAVNGLFMVYLNPLWAIDVTNSKPPLPSDSGVIVMSNHLSNADPFFTCTSLLPMETKYISKSEIFNVPFGGWCMSMIGDIPIYFTKEKGGWGTQKGTVGKMMDHCKELLSKGIHICVFPEGARSWTGQLQEFKAGMFMLAVESGTPILPMALSGSENAWPRGDWKMAPAVCSVRFGKLVATKDKTVQKVMSEVRAEMERLLKQLPPRTIRPDREPKSPASDAGSAATPKDK